jgi:hypothetical protein
MDYNIKYEKMPFIEGEAVRPFMLRYAAFTHDKRIPSKYEMDHYYRQYTELEILDINRRVEGTEWCYENLPECDWYNINCYFVFTNIDDAVLFKLAFESRLSIK